MVVRAGSLTLVFLVGRCVLDLVQGLGTRPITATVPGRVRRRVDRDRQYQSN